MNFFGHAVVASWADKRAGHLLGSMLPDFEAMLGAELIEVRDPDIRRGIDFHHRTDMGFHRTPSFISLCARAVRDLTRSGVNRGTARAVGHVGTEMFLDGWLSEQSDRVDDYLSALELDPADLLRWDDEGRGFSELRARLTGWGAPRDYANPAFVFERLSDALLPRPALAIRAETAPRVLELLPALQRAVRAKAPELLGELRNTMGLGS